MWIATFLGCSWLFPTPIETPARWAEVELLADSCAAGSDLESIEALVQWHLSDQQAVFQPRGNLSLLQLVNGRESTFSPSEVEAIAHATHALERCGGIVDTMAAAVVADRVCPSSPEVWSTTYRGYPKPSLRSVAAREALTSWDLITTAEEKSRGGGALVNDAGAELEKWVLDGEVVVAPPEIEDEKRVIAKFMLGGITFSWPDVVEARPTMATCPPP